MVDIIIADHNIYYAKLLMDYLNNRNNIVRVRFITINGKETINLLNNRNDIDLFLLDLNMPIYDGIEVLNMLFSEKKERYNNSCIVLSDNRDMIQKIKDNPIVNSYVYKGFDFVHIAKHIDKIIKNKNNLKRTKNIKNMIRRELSYLKYNFSYKGTIYLEESIYYLFVHNYKHYENLKKDVYPQIASQFNDSVHNIKCNITRATRLMYYDCEINKIIKYFGFSVDTRPTTKLVIYTILNKLNNIIIE